MSALRLLLSIYLLVLLLPATAHAYIGPGAGLTAIGAALALVGAVLLGIVGFFWYPLKRLLRGKNEGFDSMEDDHDQSATLASEHKDE